jgi:hypothetical protein
MGFSTSQWISMGLVPLSLVMLYVLSRRRAEPAAAPSPARRKKHGR